VFAVGKFANQHGFVIDRSFHAHGQSTAGRKPCGVGQFVCDDPSEVAERLLGVAGEAPEFRNVDKKDAAIRVESAVGQKSVFREAEGGIISFGKPFFARLGHGGREALGEFFARR
jgi:hypothetical protein